MVQITFQSGNGYGYGGGYGGGYGYGDGYGGCYGGGDGYGGDGYGGYGYDGDGDGDGGDQANAEYFASLLHGDNERMREARNRGGVVALWKSLEDGTPANGGSGTVARPGLVEKTKGPLSLCHQGTLHASFRPDKWKGDRLWVVAMYGEIATDTDKIGALEREILFEITK